MQPLISILFSSLSFLMIGQDVTTQTISWTSSKVTHVSTGEVITDIQKIIVYKKDRVEWLDAKGIKKYTLSIQNSKGSLKTNEQGEITYQVIGENVRGNVTIKNTSIQNTIRVVLVEDNKLIMYDLLISNYTVL